MSFRKRLLRHLSFANVVACMALFVALGGGAYAASTINGGSIVRESIGAGKLKKETITSKQIKKGALNGSVIDASSLGTVPAAQSAVTAQSADAAKTAESATKASSAGSADHATSADSAGHADTASHADSADIATHADSADHATSADSAAHADAATEAGRATSADHATEADHAADADTVGGETAADLTVKCPAETEAFGGMCWDETSRSSVFWIVANQQCAARDGRLPTLGEMIAYALRPGTPTSGERNWTSEVSDFSPGDAEVVYVDGDTPKALGQSSSAGYRCVFYRTNVQPPS